MPPARTAYTTRGNHRTTKDKIIIVDSESGTFLTCEYGPMAGGAVGQMMASRVISIFGFLPCLETEKGLCLFEGAENDFPRAT